MAKEYNDGGMVAFSIPKNLSNKIVIDGYENIDRLHITLVYMQYGELNIQQLINVVNGNLVKIDKPPNQGRLIKKQCFTNLPNNDVQSAAVLLVDIPGIYEWRELFIREIEKDGIRVNKYVKFQPHITLAYFDNYQNNPMDDKTYPFDNSIINFGEAQIWC